VATAGDSNILGPNARASRGLSYFHSPHRYTLSLSYTTPWFQKRKDFAGQALSGWKVSMVAKFAAGTPFTVINSGGFGDFDLDGFTENRPAIIDPSILGNHFSVPDRAPSLLPREAFRSATISDYSCCILSRNTFYGDGMSNFDFGLFKTFRLPFERHQFVLRADLFNAFNHAQFAFPTLDLASPTFGRITGTAAQYSPRNVQFSLRYVF
jgi:hypothetical protein